MLLCSTPHPALADVLCDKGIPCFGFHANSLQRASWPGNPLPPREEPRGKGGGSRKAQLALIAQRAR